MTTTSALEQLAEVSSQEAPLTKRLRHVGSPGAEYDVLESIMAIGRAYDESYTSSPDAVVDVDLGKKGLRRAGRRLEASPSTDDERPATPATRAGDGRNVEHAQNAAPALAQEALANRVRHWKVVAGELKDKLEELVETNGFIFTDDCILQRCLDFAASIQICSFPPVTPPQDEGASRSLRHNTVAQQPDHFTTLRLASAQIASPLKRTPAKVVRPVTLATLSKKRKIEPEDEPSDDDVKNEDADDEFSDPFDPSRCYLCGLEQHDAPLLSCCNAHCGKVVHRFCVGLEQSPKKPWPCPSCSGSPTIEVCAALHCKRKSSRRYCIVHSCRFHGCDFRLRGRGYCRRHDTSQKRTMALAATK
ncbi:hypothetical protein SPRG_04189 [Saprolegnia parasitica CBS 223.65]|uniref:PHD-type domain-containing protein n=1 Tax=Saprolegnia parasitica (strain CBS 223.65) TaxID=695850 RepID=A0A067CWS5_SAPPC|nr:hypothetical protein SPRG_04189 [Saprolegnia parasitica CBS 223.65]KDO31001.1 hypothetical protein SPRG_04189 [Saprolegnia parasitica CBS 223.65]|eukprot:XP_012198185.1 hypothetical protein SPRG_04189 [Saprolegnia parasitica CBS 223.65]